jgi:hypothetical protein
LSIQAVGTTISVVWDGSTVISVTDSTTFTGRLCRIDLFTNIAEGATDGDGLHISSVLAST